MLCPEVLNFETKPSWSPQLRQGSSLKDVDAFYDDKVVFDRLKIVVPGSLHPPEDLLRALNLDTEYYRADTFPLDLLVEPDFLATFLLKGTLFLQTQAGPDPERPFLCILPSGWLYLSALVSSLESSGLEGQVVHRSRAGDTCIIGLDLKPIAAGAHKPSSLGHLNDFLRGQHWGGSLELSSPICMTWLPNDPEVCPSSLAKYLTTQNVKLSEISTSIEKIRFSPRSGKIPSIRQSDTNQELDWFSFENWIGGAFLQIDIPSELFETEVEHEVDCKQVLCLDVQGLFWKSALQDIVQAMADHLSLQPEHYWASITSRIPTSITKTKSFRKEISYSHKTLVLQKDGSCIFGETKL